MNALHDLPITAMKTLNASINPLVIRVDVEAVTWIFRRAVHEIRGENVINASFFKN